MTTPSNRIPDRGQADEDANSADAALSEAIQATAAARRPELLYAQAQSHALLAVYHELRHGHDRQAAPAGGGEPGYRDYAAAPSDALAQSSAYGVWVLATEATPQPNALYIRGDQIVEVLRESVSPEDAFGPARVVATLAQPTDEPDAGSNRITLWSLPKLYLAGNAALRLVEILLAVESGIVVLVNADEDDEGDPHVELTSPLRGGTEPR